MEEKRPLSWKEFITGGLIGVSVFAVVALVGSTVGWLIGSWFSFLMKLGNPFIALFGG